MATFRKRPVEVEAFPVNDAIGAANHLRTLPVWLTAAFEQGDVVVLADGLSIKTLEGWLQAARGDWLIRGVKGEIYSCKADVFQETYEVVSDDDDL